MAVEVHLFNHVAIETTNVAKAVQFCQEVLDLEKLDEAKLLQARLAPVSWRSSALTTFDRTACDTSNAIAVTR
jgi:hypothetical protein